MYLVGDQSVRKYDIRIRVCDGFITRLFGALPKGRIDPDEAVLLTGCRQVHTWFMREPISLIFAADDGVIMRFIPALRPFRFSERVDGSSLVLEMAPHPFSASLLTEETVLRFEPGIARAMGFEALAMDRDGPVASEPTADVLNKRPI